MITTYVAPQNPRGELHHGITQVHHAMALERSDVRPFRFLARGQDLETAESVEE